MYKTLVKNLIINNFYPVTIDFRTVVSTKIILNYHNKFHKF